MLSPLSMDGLCSNHDDEWNR